MNINELKKLLRNSTSVLVLDNGEPSFVVMGYQTYKDLSASRAEEKEIPVRNNDNSSRYSYAGQAYPERIRHDDGVSAQYNRDRETEILERLNKEILALKSQIEMEERGAGANPHREGIDL